MEPPNNIDNRDTEFLRKSIGWYKNIEGFSDDKIEIIIVSRVLVKLPDLTRFTRLESLTIDTSGLTSLPPLPHSLKRLSCHGNHNLMSLPELPPNLEELDVNNNDLKSLPELPATLKILNCGENRLKELPELPPSLIILNCRHNLIRVLPRLPSRLLSLHCQQNRIEWMQPLPSGLRELNCNQNWLDSLPALPQRLDTLVCYDNRLTTLPDLPPALEILNCKCNLLKVLPDLPPTLSQHNMNLYGNHFTYYKRPFLIDDINRINQSLKLRHRKYCEKYRVQFRKWLWERVRQKEAMLKYHPSRIEMFLELEEPSEN